MFIEMLRQLYGKASRMLWNRRQGPVRVSPVAGRKALLSYIVSPFSPAARVMHCNHIESLGMMRVLSDMGYEVHVVDYRCRKPIDYDTYDLVIGFGHPFVASYASAAYRGKRIVYLTGASPAFSNQAEAQRLQALRRRHGVLLQPRREVYWPWCHATVNADGVIVTGNAWTRSTYAGLNRSVELVPVPHVLQQVEAGGCQEGEDGKLHFIWFSGAGAVHKGLDLVLDAMTAAPVGWHLDVCGPIAAEADFMALYRDLLSGRDNVSFHGFLPPGSAAFHEVVGRNAFVVFPSCSEGGASSVITCMAHGLIPVTTEEASVDDEGLGLRIAAATPEAVLAAMQAAAAITFQERERRRSELLRLVRDRHSAAAFEQAFATAVQNILEPVPGASQEERK